MVLLTQPRIIRARLKEPNEPNDMPNPTVHNSSRHCIVVCCRAGQWWEGILANEDEDVIAQQTRYIVGGEVNVQCMLIRKLEQGTASCLTCSFFLVGC